MLLRSSVRVKKFFTLRTTYKILSSISVCSTCLPRIVILQTVVDLSLVPTSETIDTFFTNVHTVVESYTSVADDTF